MAIDKINSEGLLLSDDFAFTGTVTGASGVNTPAFLAYRNGHQDISNEVVTKVQYNVETYDIGSCYDHTTNFRFTPNVSGKYMIYGKCHFQSPGGHLSYAKNYLKFNGDSAYPAMAGIQTYTNTVIDDSGILVAQVIAFNGSSDYIEMFGVGGHNQGDVRIAGDNSYFSYFGGYKIIE